MSDIILKADATFGLKVKIADKVREGDEIGVNADTSKALISPVSGIIRNIVFNSEEHCFEVVLSVLPQQKTS